LLVVPVAGRRLRLQPGPSVNASVCDNPGLEELRNTIPAARALPLLQWLATEAAGAVEIDNLPGASLHIEVDAR
jgi:hypothetical protein